MGAKKTIVTYLFLLTLLAGTGCNSLPKGESFKYSKGEIVYYRIDNVPMLVDKQIYKNGKKMYRVVFKNEEGYLMYNKVEEHELLSTPGQEKEEESESTE